MYKRHNTQNWSGDAQIAKQAVYCILGTAALLFQKQNLKTAFYLNRHQPQLGGNYCHLSGNMYRDQHNTPLIVIIWNNNNGQWATGHSLESKGMI